jgi:serine-type D-Ala-D-Ala carboxypeptidase/endopeptidase (penicillin-binding protein 4)
LAATTRFYLDDKRVLYVRGGGDPFLISEDLAPLATKLVATVGKKPIAGIVLDASYYPSNLRVPGIEDTDEAYNALIFALAVNFNTVYAPQRMRSNNDAVCHLLVKIEKRHVAFEARSLKV